jgi:hypothetical protein
MNMMPKILLICVLLGLVQSSRVIIDKDSESEISRESDSENGVSAACRKKCGPGFSCTRIKKQLVCNPICGDGLLVAGEEC